MSQPETHQKALSVADVCYVDDGHEVTEVTFSDGTRLYMQQTQYEAISALAGRHPHDTAAAVGVGVTAQNERS